jgi:hypothetical protein
VKELDDGGSAQAWPAPFATEFTRGSEPIDWPKPEGPTWTPPPLLTVFRAIPMPWVTPATDALEAGGAAAALGTEPGAGRPAETWLATNPSQLALPFPDRRIPFASGPTAPEATAWFEAITQGRLPDCSPLSPVVAPEALPGAGVRASALMEFNEDWPTLETDATVPGSLAPFETLALSSWPVWAVAVFTVWKVTVVGRMFHAPPFDAG